MSNNLSPIIGNDQTVSFTASSVAASTAFASDSRIVRLVSDQPCFVEFADSPTATVAGSTYLPASTPEYFVIPNPGSTKVAAIRATSTSSKLYVAEFA